MTKKEQEYQFIGDYLAQLPSDKLISQAKTDEQRIEWLRIKLDYAFFSVFWKASQSTLYNPLEYVADNK